VRFDSWLPLKSGVDQVYHGATFNTNDVVS
jgi:hypothetical protein